MKHTAPATLALVLAATFAAAPAQADPLNRKHVAAEARWVLHLDAQAFVRTKAGAYFVDEVLEPKSAQLKAEIKRQVDFDLDWRKIRSITLYGSTFQHRGNPDPTGVAVVRTDLPLQAALERALSGNTSIRVQRSKTEGGPVYTVNEDGYVAFAPGNVVLLGKGREVVERARAVVAGKSPNLQTASVLTGYPEASGASFFVGLAEGFADKADLPSNASVLKNAQGACLRVGEDGDRVKLHLSVRTPTPEVAQQVQQVAQGLLALVNLNANQKPELQALAQSCTVQTSGAMVHASASVPTAEVISKLAEKK